MTDSGPESAGLEDYLRAAFRYHWNLLFFFGGVAAAAISPLSSALLPLVTAAEIVYLAALTSMPRFRAAIDARVHMEKRAAEATARSGGNPQQSLTALMEGLDDEARERFERLRERCLQMRAIASGVGGRTGGARRTAEDVHSPGLDRLLWVFLRLLYSQRSLARFLSATEGAQIEAMLATTRRRLDEAVGDASDAAKGDDDRLVRSLRDTLATQQVRLDNYAKARGNAEFVAVELDRLEGKIQALSEMAVNRQDPDFISREVDSVAASMHHTEEAISEISMVDGLMDDLDGPPAILGADLRRTTETG